MITTMKAAAEEAISAQDAVNLSGVLKTLERITTDIIWADARERHKGTTHVNNHPIVALFLHKLCLLNGGTYTRDYSAAYQECLKIIEEGK